MDEHAALREFRAFYQVNERYWDIRNQAMARNVARYAALYPGRRLVVLCGFNQRYYLRRALRAQAHKLGFRLRDLGEWRPVSRAGGLLKHWLQVMPTAFKRPDALPLGYS